MLLLPFWPGLIQCNVDQNASLTDISLYKYKVSSLRTRGAELVPSERDSVLRLV